MLFDSVQRYREELELASQRLSGLNGEFRELGVPSERGKQILERLESQINGLETRLSEAERAGDMASLETTEFEGAWNQLFTDFELLELELLDARTMKKEKA
jgi:chromosome segregation ATPase